MDSAPPHPGLPAPPPQTGIVRRLSWDRINPQCVFLALTLVFGTAVLLVNAPFQAPDEDVHYLRVFQLSDGTLFGQKQDGNAGGQLPIIVGAVVANHDLPFHYDKKMQRSYFAEKLQPAFVRWDDKLPRQFTSFAHSVYYPPGAYLPQTFAMVLGRLLRIGPLGLMYLARLGGFAASVGLGCAALGCLPMYRWTALVVLLCPMSLYLMGSVATDGVMITGSFLLIALALRAGSDPARRVTTGEMALILALTAVIGMAKVVYLPVCVAAVVLLLPHLRSRREQIFLCLAYGFFCLLPAWLWGHRVAPLFVAGRTDYPIDPVAQLHFMEDNPLGFLTLVGVTIKAFYLDIYYSFVGNLGWGDTMLPMWFYPVFSCGVLLCLVLESPGAVMVRWPQRLMMVGAAAAGALLIFAAQYMFWNPPGSLAPIEGVQPGRYFLPLVPLVIMSFPSLPRLRVPDRWAKMVGCSLGFTSAALCLYAVILRYYIP